MPATRSGENASDASRDGARIAGVTLVLCVVALGALVPTVAAQTQPEPPATVAAVVSAEPSEEVFVLTYANRPIATLRARVLGRRPIERAGAAERILDQLVADRIGGPVELRALDAGVLITVAGRTVSGLTPFDIDELAGETLQGVAAQTATRLQQALSEAIEARTAATLLSSGVMAAVGLVAGLLLLFGLFRAHRAFVGRLVGVAERKLAEAGLADLAALRASRLLDFQRGVLTSIAATLGLVVTYVTLTFVLRRFPYTRPWGESMRGFLLDTAGTLGLGIVNAIPGLFTIAVIFLLIRFAVRIVGLWFTAVEQGRVRARYLYPETAQPTRRLATALLWLFGIVVAYPYMPGSQSDAFKGVSVFLGLMVTFGSTGIVNQIMSGFMVTYSRALRVGDFVRIGDVEGIVVHLGVLSTKVRTLRNEEVTIPNAVVVSQTTTDYSRFADGGGVYTPTTVTIGYDAPWRQVQALLLLAAERTDGLCREPTPVVLQMGLEDFYVRYTLFVSLERQDRRAFTLHHLHANIQDLFNEHGVQIMSPNYVLDPSAPKVVAKKDWYAAPARPE